MSAHRTNYRPDQPARQPMSAKALFLITFIVLTLVAGALGNLLDAKDDNSTEWTEAQLMLEIQATEARTARRQAAEQRLCNKLRGPNSEVRYTPDGDAVCTTRRGFAKLGVQL